MGGDKLAHSVLDLIHVGHVGLRDERDASGIGHFSGDLPRRLNIASKHGNRGSALGQANGNCASYAGRRTCNDRAFALVTRHFSGPHVFEARAALPQRSKVDDTIKPDCRTGHYGNSVRHAQSINVQG